MRINFWSVASENFGQVAASKGSSIPRSINISTTPAPLRGFVCVDYFVSRGITQKGAPGCGLAFEKRNIGAFLRSVLDRCSSKQRTLTYSLVSFLWCKTYKEFVWI